MLKVRCCYLCHENNSDPKFKSCLECRLVQRKRMKDVYGKNKTKKITKVSEYKKAHPEKVKQWNRISYLRNKKKKYNARNKKR